MLVLIHRLKLRLGMSHGQLLALAREVAEDATVQGMHDLTEDQRDKLVYLMQHLAIRRIDTAWVA